jgi:formylglycine-generating enzyme required for sulfatase activity
LTGAAVELGHFLVAESAEALGSETKTRVFVSYSRKDMAFADKLEAALKARGFEVLIDRQEIYAFEDWWKRIEALIGQSDTVIFVLSPDAVKSDVALKEVAHAASLNKRFAPIVCRRVEDATVPDALRLLNFIFFDDPERFEASADKLALALNTNIGWIRQHSEFGEAARHWSMAGRPDGLLLRSPLLEQAELWIKAHPHGAPEPTGETQAFIAESRRGTIRRRRRAQALVGTFIAVIVVGLAAWWKQDWLHQQIYVLRNVHALTTTQETVLEPGDDFSECTNCPEMVVVPAGSFAMGAPATESQALFYDTEIPQHPVTIARNFAVSKFELTFAEWDSCANQGGCAAHIPDSDWGRGRQPVINVTWDEAKDYAAWLSRITGKTYRLLSEAEYEYAARAGTTTAYPWGNDIGKNNANCGVCGSQWDGKRTAPVGSFPPNKFRLYDMIGNVFEWTEDCYHKTYNGAPTDGSAWLAANGGDCTTRVVRGGSWEVTEEFVRSAHRAASSTVTFSSIYGFRVARTLDTK